MCWLYRSSYCFSLVAQEAVIKKCEPTKSTISVQVAYAHHFMESNGKTLSLRVSVGAQHNRTQTFFTESAAAIAEKYRNEEGWNLLIFSDHKIAKTCTAPYPEQNEPPEYIGACIGVRDSFKGLSNNDGQAPTYG